MRGMKSHIQFCAKHCTTNLKYCIRKRKEISAWCGVLWVSLIREKASKNGKKLRRQNDERFYQGRNLSIKV